MLKASNIRIEFEDVILNDTSFIIPEHCITLIRGYSGSGKTSLLYRISLISEDHSFSYVIDNQLILNMSDKDKASFRKEHLAFVLQDNSLFDHYDVLGNLQIYAQFNRKQYTEKKYRRFLKSVNLSVPLHQPIDTLSGGEKQRLAIACALCKDTEIIVLDEPTSFLDEENELNVLKVLRNIADEYQKTIIITSHSKHAIEIADEVYEIHDKDLIERKHYEEVHHDTFPLSHKGFTYSFYKSYILYFYKKYLKFETSIIALLSLSLFIMCLLLIHTDLATAKSVHFFQEMSENQIFITKDTNNITVDSTLADFPFSYNNIETYPFIDTIAIINNTPCPLLPLFPKNNIQNRLITRYRDEGIYISFGCYRQLMDAMVNPDNLEIGIVLETTEEEYQTYEKTLPIAGIFDSNFSSPYLSRGKDCFAYCSYETLKNIYAEYGLFNLNRYKGYTLFADDFDTYVSMSEDLQKEGYGTTLFFIYIDEMKRLKSLNTKVRISISALGLMLTFILFAMMEYIYARKRDKEMIMLKLNGANNAQIMYILLFNSFIQCLFSLFVNSSILFAEGLILHIAILQYFLLLTSLVLSVFIFNIFLQYMYVNRISIEKILRS